MSLEKPIGGEIKYWFVNMRNYCGLGDDEMWVLPGVSF